METHECHGMTQMVNLFHYFSVGVSKSQVPTFQPYFLYIFFFYLQNSFKDSGGQTARETKCPCASPRAIRVSAKVTKEEGTMEKTFDELKSTETNGPHYCR